MLFAFLSLLEALWFSSFCTTICRAAGSLWLPGSPAVWVLLIASPVHPSGLCTGRALAADPETGSDSGLIPFWRYYLVCGQTERGTWFLIVSPFAMWTTLWLFVNACAHEFIWSFAKGDIRIRSSLWVTIYQLNFQEFKEKAILLIYLLTVSSGLSFPLAGREILFVGVGGAWWSPSVFTSMKISLFSHQLWKRFPGYRILGRHLKVEFHCLLASVFLLRNWLLLLSLPLSLAHLFPCGHLCIFPSAVRLSHLTTSPTVFSFVVYLAWFCWVSWFDRLMF